MNQPDAVPRRRRADARANHAALLEAAATLYSERGLEVPYDEIARAGGVGRATLYRHFPTRELLLAAIFEQRLDEIGDIAEHLSPTPGRFFELLDACVCAHQDALPLIDLARRSASEQTAVLQRRFVELFTGPLADAQQAGLVRPEIKPEDVRVLLMMISSLAPDTVAEQDRSRARELIGLLLRQDVQSQGGRR